MAQLKVDAVTKRYDERTAAVRDVSLTVRDGETVTVLGPSGCGKSTLLRLIAGLERPTGGRILLDGVDVTEREPRDRDVAMVFQSYALYPHMTARQNIAVALRLRRVPAADRETRVHRAATLLGIQHLLDRRPRALSGGERQRVALARALVRDPKIFLLDEPLSNLDALLREHARAELKALFQRLRATVIYVTHDQIEAMTLSDRVVVMRRGTVEQIGAPEDIYQAPETVFVASFVGSPRMNLLEGRVLGRSAHTIGIRPEDVGLAPDAPLRMRVRLRESLGAQQLLTLQAERLELKALLPAGRAVAEGDEVGVAIDYRRAHFFDENGRRLDERGRLETEGDEHP